jgi:transposase
VIGRVARQLGIGDQSLRTWVAQAEIEGGKRAGLTAEERAELNSSQGEP